MACAFLIACCFGGCYGCSHVKTGDGYRDSTIRRGVETGLIFKTYEVESLGDGFRLNDGKASPETFNYTVKDPAIREQISNLPPETKARIHYQKMIIAWKPNGESRYIITKIEPVK